MIQYSLKCCNGHRFDSWFQSADAFDTLLGRGLVTCAICGVTEVEKAIMAPRVQSGRRSEAAKREAAERQTTETAPEPPSMPAADAPKTATDAPPLAAPTDQERALAEVKRHVEENSDYVGKNFAQEARAMHVGDAPERAIYGEANLKEAKELIEDGVPVVPLPFAPKRKTN